MFSSNHFTLSNGIEIPCIGFGTDRTFIFLRKNIIKGFFGIIKDITSGGCYHLRRDTSIINIVKNGPANGCFLYDTASSYGQSERVLGYALNKYKRGDLFVITKLSNEEQRCGDVDLALRKSLRRLKTDYVDLYLMHWPQTGAYINSWRQMEKVYQKGLAKAIGVCNFKRHHFDELMKDAEICPMVCQIESHPLFAQEDMLRFCKDNNIQMMAYTPTGRMNKRILQNGDITEIAQKHNKSIAQVVMRWHHQRKVIPVVNTTSLAHLIENMDIFDFFLTDEEMARIDRMNIDCRLRYDPDTVDFTKC